MAECIFCKIAKGEIPSRKVLDDEHCFAFLDINPRNPGHTLVIPKRHAQDIFSIEPDEASELMGAIRRVAIAIQKATGAKGLNVIQNNGQLAGQLVPHIHFHLIPRTEAERGVAIESVLPVKKLEDAAMGALASKIAASMPREERAKKAENIAEKPHPVKQEKKRADPEEQDISFEEF